LRYLKRIGDVPGTGGGEGFDRQSLARQERRLMITISTAFDSRPANTPGSVIMRVAGLVFLVVFLAVAFALPGEAAQPEPWQLGFQEAATPVKEAIHNFHNFILVIITAITLFVLALLIYVMVRFNAKANPTPSKTSHNTMIEVVWTVVPVIILVVIAIPSFRLLYLEQTIPEPDITIKTTGYQWYWSYEYPDQDGMVFDSIMLRDDELAEGQPRLLAVDNPMVVPVGATVKMLVTAADVLHNWAMPAFGVKMDAVPGRLNETWFRAEKEGIYYGQCSELCGRDHAFMPIEVRVVSQEEYALWLDDAKTRYSPPTRHRASKSKRLETSTNHKDIGTMYLIFAIFAGIRRRRSVGRPCAWSCRTRACRSSAMASTCTTCSSPPTA
jgi:cytochrome c oxidase subunit 2